MSRDKYHERLCAQLYAEIAECKREKQRLQDVNTFLVITTTIVILLSGYLLLRG